MNSDPSELESLTAETNPSRDAQAILKQRENPKHSTAQADRKSKSTDSLKSATPEKATPFDTALPRSVAATAKTQVSKKSTKKKKTGGEFGGSPIALAHLTDWKTKYPT